ncbi:MAG TPA: preprotein translocase subunit YajC [Terriglobales bacterium]|nr:MAG: preprotein translocase subunit YajC [Acidobacteriota bacterium]HTC78206.1 preprotein translocase subunit YajC [Terriglobales bacterium]
MMNLAVIWQSQAGGSMAALLLPLVIMLVFAYVLLILPQQKRQKKWQIMVDALKAGDRVITSGGLRGTVIALKDDALHLRVPPDNLRIEVAKSSVVSVATEEK